MTVSTFIFLAFAEYAATLVAVAVHELVGHGLVALSLGGRFSDLYVGRLGGSASASASGSLNDVVLAAGGLVTALVGAAAWVHAGKRLRTHGSRGLASTIVLWLLANEAILDSVGYMTLQPAIASLLGRGSGDWFLLSVGWGVSPWLLFAPGLLLAAWLATGLVRDGHEIVGHLLPARRLRPLWAYWLLLAPGTALGAVHLALAWRWIERPLPLALAGLLGTPMLGALGALRLRRGDVTPSGAAVTRSPMTAPPRGAMAWSVACVVLAGAVVWIFGPTERHRRGLALAAPTPERYMEAAQTIRVEVDVSSGAGPRLRITSLPRPGVGSPYRRRLTEALAEVGPSRAGASELTRFIARWNLDGAEALSVEVPVRRAGAWTWEAELAPLADSIMVRLWPLTWVEESHVVAIRLDGAALDPGATWAPRAVSAGDSGVSWTRPDEMTGIDSFRVRVR